MIPGDLTAELARVLAAQVAAGALPPAVATRTANGTWRPPRAPSTTSTTPAAGPGSYSTSLPLELASLTSRHPEAIAAQLGDQLSGVPWISMAGASDSFLTVTVAPTHLARLPARIVAAGPASARSGALAGAAFGAPRPPDLATAPSWAAAWRAQRAALTGRLGEAAGAQVQFLPAERNAVVASPAPAGAGPPSAAVAYYGVDAVRFALAAAATPRPVAIERQLGRPLDLTNPFVRIRYAHADAASTLRWAAALRLARSPAASALQPSASLAPSALPPTASAPPSLAPSARTPLAAPAQTPLTPSAQTPLAPPAAPAASAPPPAASAPPPAASAPLPTLPPAASAGQATAITLEPAELRLIDAMSWLAERVAAAYRRRRPADLVAYLDELADAWLTCSLSCSALPFRGGGAATDPAATATRLELAEAASVTLAAGLGLLGVAAPAMM